MCGIVGYIGNKQAAPILLEGLAKLEYRGYDSAGIAVLTPQNEIEVVKAKGRLKVLREKTNDGKSVAGCVGIGHTRWATHGEPSEVNAHPHCSDDGKIAGVHNGIIENHRELKEKLLRHGYHFYSATDTEVAVKLVHYYYIKYQEGPLEALRRAMLRMRGSYALALLFQDNPQHIYAARKDAPMIVGIEDKQAFLASDATAILKHTRSVYYIDNLEMACLGAGEVSFYNIDGEIIEKPLQQITWDAQAAEKCGYEHFMMKEIHEQPSAVENTLRAANKDQQLNIENFGMSLKEAQSLQHITIVACGSAYHVGVVAQYVLEETCRIPTRVEYASEFRYRKPIIGENEWAIFISQSGETADTLAGLREAKARGAKTLAVVNVVGSTIAREADSVFYTLAGPEIAVATTKAYSAQLVTMYSFALALAKARGLLTLTQEQHYLEEMFRLPEQIAKVLEDKERLQWFASKVSNARDIFFIGRGIDYAISLEGSLKLKEISYIHSEAYAAGELKHGTISLIEEGTLVIGVCTQDALYEKTLSNMVEVKSRGAYLMGVTAYGRYDMEDTADFTVYIPQTDKLFTASLAVVSLQLLGYYVAVARGLNVDKPRNLAKSVTVE